ncbi:hypothetical protein [Curtobacterium sp. MCPF17_046]|uniref:hypothetical protein n=1 Tax=Curtobacterium sp. MCPF17_046 TaxID=2175663 RepID=UPI000D8DFC99|nr:hypothetical protein [Curtobacterium sp. MCPF17_046]PYY40835.1 hypothetical protein DEJ32_05580 [Curtobacterium sp. MCPF17_046]
MSRRLRPVSTASILLVAVTATVLTGCSGGGTPDPTPSASHHRTASPTPTRSAAPSSPASSPSSTSAPAVPSAGPSAGADDGTGTGTGNGSGVDDPETVDFAAVSAQGVAAAGGGTVISLAGSGDNWTVLVAGPDGSRTQSVVSATLGRVTSGPFPRDSDAPTKAADAARATAATVDAAAAASTATNTVSGSRLVSAELGGPESAPVWTVLVTVDGAQRTVTVDARTGAATAS